MKMKIWSNGQWVDIDIWNISNEFDEEDGYCTCQACQKQKKIDQIKKDSLPDEMFEL